MRSELYYELPMGISELQALVRFRLGSHTLPMKQGCFLSQREREFIQPARLADLS